MLFLSVFALSMPTIYADDMNSRDPDVQHSVVRMSVYLSVLLLIAYALFLVFQLLTNSADFGGDEEDEEPDMKPLAAAILLIFCTVACDRSTDALIESLQGTISELGLSKEFIGIILLPIIGNAAEHYTAITVAMKDKMDLALGVAVGSSCQMALLVSPFAVLAGYAVGKPDHPEEFDVVCSYHVPSDGYLRLDVADRVLVKFWQGADEWDASGWCFGHVVGDASRSGWFPQRVLATRRFVTF